MSIENQIQRHGSRLPIAAKPKRKRGVGYTPGMYDRLLAVPERTRPEELTGLSLDLSSGALVLTEHTKRGTSPVRRMPELPYSVELSLPNGELVLVEISALGNVMSCAKEPMLEDAEPLPWSPEDAFWLPGDFFAFSADE